MALTTVFTHVESSPIPTEVEETTSALVTALEMVIYVRRGFQVFLFCLVVLGNFLTLTALIQFRWLRSKSNLIVASLAVTDLGVGLRIILTYIQWLYPTPLHETVDAIFYLFRATVMYSSVCHIVLVALDRFIAIVYPFYYGTHVTRTTTKIMIGITWGVALGLFLSHWAIGRIQDVGMLVHVSRFKVYSSIEIGMYVLISTSLLVFHGTITRIAVKQRVQVEAMEQQQAGIRRQHAPQSENGEAGETKGDPKKSGSMSIKKGTDRATKMFLLVMGAFVVLFFPYILFLVLTHIFGATSIPLAILYHVSITTAECNSAINAFIYGVSNSRFRLAFKKVLTCDRRPVDDSTTMTMTMT